jgi:hypothetical protein
MPGMVEELVESQEDMVEVAADIVEIAESMVERRRREWRGWSVRIPGSLP